MSSRYVSLTLACALALASVHCDDAPAPTLDPSPAPGVTDASTMDAEPTRAIHDGPHVVLAPGDHERASFHTLPLGLAAFGALEPGDRVDVIGTFGRGPALEGTTAPGTTSRLLLQDVEVLGAYPPEDGAVTVALSLTLAESEALTIAEGSGALELLVRDPESRWLSGATRMTLDDALNDLEIFHMTRIRRRRGARARLKKWDRGKAAAAKDLEMVRRVGLPLELPAAALRAFTSGDRVDVTATLSLPDSVKASIPRHLVMRLLQDVTVLDVHPDHGGLTLDLTPDEAILFALSRAHGTLHVVRRHPDDDAVMDPAYSTLPRAFESFESMQLERRDRTKRRLDATASDARPAEE